jgi:hypothetical protein
MTLFWRATYWTRLIHWHWICFEDDMKKDWKREKDNQIEMGTVWYGGESWVHMNRS